MGYLEKCDNFWLSILTSPLFLFCPVSGVFCSPALVPLLVLQSREHVCGVASALCRARILLFPPSILRCLFPRTSHILTDFLVIYNTRASPVPVKGKFQNDLLMKIIFIVWMLICVLLFVFKGNRGCWEEND